LCASDQLGLNLALWDRVPHQLGLKDGAIISHCSGTGTFFEQGWEAENIGVGCRKYKI